MKHSAQAEFEFQAYFKRQVTADNHGGQQTSDGGSLLLRESLLNSSLIPRLAECFYDYRKPEAIEHSLESMLTQRIAGLALGYEDINDHEQLRKDPAQVLLANKKGLGGEEPVTLAGKSTLNRMELSAEGGDGRYKKIIARSDKIESLLIKQGVKAIPRRTREIVLDFDATDDLIHGTQEGRFYNGYYGDYCYLPLYCFHGDVPLLAKLRKSDGDASEGTVEALAQIVPAIRKRFGKKIRIILRADSGFARESILSWCERHNVYYCVGLAKNPRLTTELEEIYAKMAGKVEKGELRSPCRRFKQFHYQTLSSWSRSRRVIGKAELLREKKNSRFIVTNLPVLGFSEDPHGRFAPRSLYQDFYCARGNMENRIKEQQLELFADRTSTYSMKSNQLRLWFSAFAHLLMSLFRKKGLAGTPLAKATVGTIRLKLFKVSARITISTRRIHFEFPSSYPYQAEFAAVLRNLRSGFV